MFYIGTPNSGTIMPRFNSIAAYYRAILYMETIKMLMYYTTPTIPKYISPEVYFCREDVLKRMGHADP